MVSNFTKKIQGWYFEWKKELVIFRYHFQISRYYFQYLQGLTDFY